MATCVLVPLKADAFILNEKCCDQDAFKIAPIEQPNYAFLRIDSHLLESDLLDHVDIHAARPANINQRLTDLGSGDIRRSRLGVYLHWVLPPFYRTGTGATKDANDPNIPKAAQNAATDPTAPVFRPVPNRWLVTRRLDLESCSPKGKLPEFESWVVQSDCIRKLSVPDDPEGETCSLDKLDLEVDTSPFVDSRIVDAKNKLQDDVISSQGEVFVGKKTPFADWNRDLADKEPHVDLNIMASTNPLLVDYQPHNSNIFSIIDSFAYKENDKTMYLDVAQADYNIVGWHASADDDPMRIPITVDINTHQDRLKACKLVLKGYDENKTAESPWGEATKAWLKEDGEQAKLNARLVCHASMYNVKWSPELPDKVLARDAGNDQNKQSFAIGASELDAIIAYFKTQEASDIKRNQPTPQNEPAPSKNVATDIERLIHILGESGEGDIEGYRKFSDEISQFSYHRIDAGTTWSWKEQSKPNEKPKVPSATEVQTLSSLNHAQAELEHLRREQADQQWKIFAVWWTWVSSSEVQNRAEAYKKKLSTLVGQLASITATSKSLEKKINEIVASDRFSKNSASCYYQRKDPSILFSRVGSGWEQDFSKPIEARRHQQAIKAGASDAALQKTCAEIKQLATKTPNDILDGVQALLEEFVTLKTTAKDQLDLKSQVLPFFRDTNRDLWHDTQPWRPLFIEWEALYYNIPFEKWKSSENRKLNKFGASELRYVVPEDVSALFDPDITKDKGLKDIIRIAGRNYLHPQAISTFRTLIEQVFLNTNPQVLATEYGVKPEDKGRLIEIIEQMQFLSSPLAAITNTLLTIRNGSHLTPLVNLPELAPLVLKEAIQKFVDIGNSVEDAEKILQLISSQSDLTPFGSSVPSNRQTYPFKPLQHGQFQFIKLNIVDKFGQVVHLVDPRPPQNRQFYTVCPIISDSLLPGTIAEELKERPNIPLRQANPDACPFAGLPPTINQPARLNAVFVKKIKEGNEWKWRRCSDWESPVWGWMVVNYANSGIQFFLDNGQFYREVRFSEKGTSTGFRYLPFDPPMKDGKIETNGVTQLDYLIEKFSDARYLKAFWDMINTSFHREYAVHAPASFSTYSSAIVGKPLALVNSGWSLELSQKPKQDWTTLDVMQPDLKPPRTLLKPNSKGDQVDQWESADPKPFSDDKAPEAAKKGFTFPVKIGDHARRYDGLVGYFLPSSGKLQETGADLNLSNLYTFSNFFSKSPKQGDPRVEGDPRIPLSIENYPRYTPYWFPPLDSADNLRHHDDKLQVLGMIMDPFQPVHAFSAILPTRSLKLPQWIVEQSLKRMTAFWNAGPLLITQDVEKQFSKDRALSMDYMATLLEKLKTPPKNDPAAQADFKIPSVQLPLSPPTAAANGSNASFVYLQPYLVNDGTGGAEINTRYNPYLIDPNAATGGDAHEAKLAAGPYTAVEGYLQIAKSLKEDLLS